MFSLRCNDIQSHLTCGKSMRTGSYANSASHQPTLSHAFTRPSSTTSMSSSCVRLMTLLRLSLQRRLVTSYLTILIDKALRLVDLFNGVDALQTQYYIKILVETYLNKIMPKHIVSWMKTDGIHDRSTPLATRAKFMEHFLSQSGDPDPKVQAKLAKQHGFAYCRGIGEIIYVMTTACPDLAFATVCASQNSSCPAEIHYHSIHHILKYL